MRVFRVAYPLAVLLTALPAAAVELTLFAAASLSDALREIAPLHARATGHTLRFNFGGSGNLARQIRAGARADGFFSADEHRIDQLAAAGLLVPDSRRALLANTLVLVVAARDGTRIERLSDLTQGGIRRIAIGEPATVPAGTYAQQHLERVGLWLPVRDRCVRLDNVRAVLAAVGAGNADAGFVYRSDALTSPRVAIAVEVPLAEGPPIRYVIGVLTSSRHPAAARALVHFLAGPEAGAVFARHHFIVLSKLP